MVVILYSRYLFFLIFIYSFLNCEANSLVLNNSYNNISVNTVKKSDYFTYEQFGAKGDGITDDFNAIIATHNEANKRDLPVKANDNGIYYIGPTIATAIVQTNVDFGKAKFIIDDRNVDNSRTNRSKNIFSIQSKLKSFPITDIKQLKKGKKSLVKKLPHRCLIKKKK